MGPTLDDEVEDLGNVRDGFHDWEINLAMCYTLDDCAKCSIEGSGFDFNNQEKIEARYDKKEDEEILEKNLEQQEQVIRQQNEDKCDEDMRKWVKGYMLRTLGISKLGKQEIYIIHGGQSLFDQRNNSYALSMTKWIMQEMLFQGCKCATK